MTTYYGVWSGEEWAFVGLEIFHTTAIGLARAQAMLQTRWFPKATWQARAIGEDGLPVEKDIGTAVDLLADAERRLRALPSVEEAYVSIEFILQRADTKLAPAQFAEYVLGVKAAAETITDALATKRGVSVIGSIGGAHAVDIMEEVT